ncbi:regucalcin-like [Amphiura filiformis]|uniref:regucalcin-like n=1 Tax=Amphiura filiformis TaxID=82378 RepID=UPI003B2200BA
MSPFLRAMSVEVLRCTTRPDALLEGPHWEPQTQSLLYVEIYSRKIHRYTPRTNTVETVTVGEYVGAIVPTKSGRLLIAGQRRFSYLDWASGTLTKIAEVEIDKPVNRFNDAKCDPAGRIWAGTLAEQDPPNRYVLESGALYCLHPDRTVTKHADKITISNGLAWSPDRRTMYFIDTSTCCVDAFDYDIAWGSIKNRRHVVEIPSEEGFPDGMCIDSDGMLWVACYMGSRVNRYDPKTGKKIQTISFPVSNITSCCFGGPTYEDLYVTTSSFRMRREQLRDQPLAGSVFVVKGLGVKGPPAVIYNDIPSSSL